MRFGQTQHPDWRDVTDFVYPDPLHPAHPLFLLKHFASLRVLRAFVVKFPPSQLE